VSVAPVSDSLQPAQFIDRIAGDVGRLYRMGIRDFEVATYPNEHGGGWGWLWKDGEAFAAWFTEVVRRLRGLFPEGRFGFPTLAIGGEAAGRQQEPLAFLRQAETAVQDADWLGLACTPNPRDALLVAYLNNYPKKPIVITELAADSETALPEALAIRSVAFVQALRETSVEVVLVRGPGGEEQAEESKTFSWEALGFFLNHSRLNGGRGRAYAVVPARNA
jgi:hypothetical protein